MALSIGERKTKLRARFKTARRGIPPAEKEIRDRRIRERIEALPVCREAACLLCYVPLPDEIDTTELIRRALAQGKTVCVPRSEPETCTIDFYRIRSLDELAPGSYGVWEPVPEKAEKVADFPHPAVCVVPGLAFDKEGYRLGYGKGYYDRFLQRFHGVKIGVCYSDMILKLLPRGRFDLPVDWLITENASRRIDGDGRRNGNGGGTAPEQRRE